MLAKLGLSLGAIALLFGFAILVPFGDVNAKSRPSIKEVRGRKVDQIKLPIKYEKYAGKKVRIKLQVKNAHTGELVRESKHNRKLDGEGRVTLKVKDLDPNTLYEFKVKIRKKSGGDYSDKSKKRLGSTKYVGQD